MPFKRYLERWRHCDVMSDWSASIVTSHKPTDTRLSCGWLSGRDPPCSLRAWDGVCREWGDHDLDDYDDDDDDDEGERRPSRRRNVPFHYRT